MVTFNFNPVILFSDFSNLVMTFWRKYILVHQEVLVKKCIIHSNQLINLFNILKWVIRLHEYAHFKSFTTNFTIYFIYQQMYTLKYKQNKNENHRTQEVQFAGEI